MDEMLALEGHFTIEDLFLRLGSDVFADAHRDGTGDGSAHTGEQNLGGVEPTTDDSRNEQEHGHQAVVDAENDVSPILSRIAEVFDIGHFALGADRGIAHKPPL